MARRLRAYAPAVTEPRRGEPRRSADEPPTSSTLPDKVTAFGDILTVARKLGLDIMVQDGKEGRPVLERGAVEHGAGGGAQLFLPFA